MCSIIKCKKVSCTVGQVGHCLIYGIKFEFNDIIY